MSVHASSAMRVAGPARIYIAEYEKSSNSVLLSIVLVELIGRVANLAK